mmetsp:Transcript_22473/g.36347  ORF Transcript_22473/g.36347 Transcript_22473/m.36347 type:complete len:659 (+) Transcript_22473:108-2084(+)
MDFTRQIHKPLFGKGGWSNFFCCVLLISLWCRGRVHAFSLGMRFHGLSRMASPRESANNIWPIRRFEVGFTQAVTKGVGSSPALASLTLEAAEESSASSSSDRYLNPMWVNSTVATDPFSGRSVTPEENGGTAFDEALQAGGARVSVQPNCPPEVIEIRHAHDKERLLAPRWGPEIETAEEFDALLDPPMKTQTGRFADMFRGAAPYIRRHRTSTMVLHIPGALMGTHVLDAIASDAALLALLGIRLAVVVGARPQIDRRLRERGLTPRYHGAFRVTDAQALEVVKEAAGAARIEVESRLARSMEGGGGGADARVQVVGGNFYTAQPFGVVGGVDFGFSGKVRRVETQAIEARLAMGDVVVLTSVGYSASGETFNVNSEKLAAAVAGSLKASKAIFLTEGQQLVDRRTGGLLQSLRLKDATAFVEARARPAGYSEIGAGEEDEDYSLVAAARGACEALRGGATRAHLVAPHPGALVQELYTRDGAGTLIAKDLYDDIRPATPGDIPAIVGIIRPLEEAGFLVPRSEQQIEESLHHYYVFAREDGPVAVATLAPYDGTHAEIGCFAVAPRYRQAGRGDAMLNYLERLASNLGIATLFCLSTQTMQWFEERGFRPASPEALPPSRYATYNWQRAARVYVKPVPQGRQLDAEELFMDVKDI